MQPSDPLSAVAPEEDFLLLILSDSNLPTGGFHFSAGLESSTKHGFVPKSSSAFPSLITPFIIHSLRSHARSTLAFVADAHGVTKAALADPLTSSTSTATTVAELTRIDALYEAMTSNHVTRRGSRTQGIGMLSLWTKALRDPRDNGRSASERLMAALKLEIRENRMHGHLPICWAVLCAALGLSLERTLHLHLFLHTRSILSSSVRLNQTGPYHAQQILLHSVRPLISAELAYYHAHKGMGGVLLRGISRSEGVDDDEESLEWGPAQTWPLGEILQARHDVMHTRMFNS